MEATGGLSRRSALKAAGAAGATAIAIGARTGEAHARVGEGGDDRGRNRGVEPDAGRLEDVGAVVGHRDRGAAAAQGTGGQARPRRSGEGRSGPHGRDARRDLVLRLGSPGFRWNQIGAELLVANPAPDTFRVITYLNLAIYDATIASWAWKQRYRRRRPSDHRLKTAIDTPNSPSYPSEHGAGRGRRGGRRAQPPLSGQGDRAGRAGSRARCLTRRRRCRAPQRLRQGRLRARQSGRRQGRPRADRRRRIGAPYPSDPNAPYPGGDGSYPIVPKDEGFQIMIGEWTPLVIGDVTAFRPPPPPARPRPSGRPNWPR